MEIVLSPDPRLLEPCHPIDVIDDSVRELAANMAEEMYRSNGVGLAAPQVGVQKRMVVVDCDLDEYGKRPLVLINPEVIWSSEELEHAGEGCLSIPGVSFEIERPVGVKVRALDLEGEEVIHDAPEGLFARCLQHEIDHVNGITMFERIDPSKRIQALREYREALARGAKPGDVGE